MKGLDFLFLYFSYWENSQSIIDLIVYRVKTRVNSE